MIRRKLKPIERYVAEIIVLGSCAAALTLTRVGVEWQRMTPAIGALMVLVVLGEAYPIRVRMRDEAEDVTTSTAFMLAVLVLAGPALALAAQIVASVLSDLRTRKEWWKASFNAAQYAIAITAAGAIGKIASGTGATGIPRFDAQDVAAALAAGVAFFVVNNLLVIAAVSIAHNVSVRRELRMNLTFHTATTMVLIAQAPLIALAASHSILWITLFMPGILAIYHTAQISAAKDELATHDPLTGLPNRVLFHDRLTRTLEEHAGTMVAVMLVDLDGFKEVNDTLGHHVGDSLLRQVAARLSGTFDERLVARLGGDEFAVVSIVDDRAEATAIGREVLASLQQPFSLQDLPFCIEASVGAALYPEHGGDVETLLQRADVAMYLAKEHRAGYETYNPTNDRYSPRRLALLGELRRAIEQSELVLHYQPIADLCTGAVTRAEALVRWHHPDHGLLQPGEFIPLAEPTGLMGALTRHVLELAVSEYRIWRDQGLDITIAVNISARNLHQSDFIQDAEYLLQKWSVPPSALELEITESAVMADPRKATEVLHALGQRGITTSLDDFGTGYSSLAYLKRLPVRALKIDRSFVAEMATDDEDAAIVASTIELARSLGLAIIAEGVENETTWKQLRELRCDAAQGYYLSRPLPAAQFARWAEQHNRTHESATRSSTSLRTEEAKRLLSSPLATPDLRAPSARPRLQYPARRVDV